MKFIELPIRYKLTYINLIISGAIVLLACLVLAVGDYFSLRDFILKNTRIKGAMSASDIAAAVQFDDQPAAAKILHSLRLDENIVAARVYDKDGKPFATYHMSSEIEAEAYNRVKADIFALVANHDHQFSAEDKDTLTDFFTFQDQRVLLEEQRGRVLHLEAKHPELNKNQQHPLEQRIATYDSLLPAEWAGELLRFNWREVTLATPINHENQILGYFYLVYDQQDLRQRAYIYLLIILAVVAVSIVIAHALAARLQRSITEPVLELANLMRTVSEQKNYSLRAGYRSTDELGVFASGFNEMLQAIQERDDKLESYNAQLEKTVAKRTAELKKLNVKLSYQAFHDVLTNLPNRAKFVQQANDAINFAARNGHGMAMLFIDLDNFKYINDTLGHAAGDRMIQEVGKRLQATTRQAEDLVARLGGDEFTILLHQIKNPEHAGVVAEKIVRALSIPFRYNGRDLYITPSIGISLFPEHGKDVGTLMRNADSSMFQAKRQGRNNYRYYNPENDQTSANRLNLEHQLRQALNSSEFEVWYQPRFILATGRLIGAEALVRWRSPDLALVPPAEFIPLAEDTGLIVPIGEWVLQRACQDCQQWQGFCANPVQVSVNLSARQFAQEDLLEKIGTLLKQTGLETGLLELELTESLIMPNAEETVQTLRKLKEMGIKISIDDFGTGYSSLSYLQQFPIDIIKIDQSFLQEVRESHQESALVTAIIAMAHNLRLHVVAEGVETQVQFNFLQQYQCDQVQGYLLGKPVPAELFARVLRQAPDMHSFSKLATA